VEFNFRGELVTLPSVDLELYFNFMPSLRIYAPGYYLLDNPKVFLTGFHPPGHMTISRLEGLGKACGFVVVFKPIGFHKAFRVRGADLFRNIIPVETLSRWDFLEICDLLSRLDNIHSMKVCFEERFKCLISNTDQTEELLDLVIRYVRRTNGCGRIGQLCERFNITARTLHRKFTENTGMSPKEYLMSCPQGLIMPLDC
jgi:AraC-like DNA-binding protein